MTETSIPPEPSAASGREPTLADVLHDLWRARLYVVSGAMIGLVMAGVVMLTVMPHYRATMMIGPAERPSGSPDVKALLPENSSFAVQYLIDSLGPRDSTDFARFQHILRRNSVAARLVGDPVIRQGLEQDGFFKAASSEPPASAAAFSLYLRDRVTVTPVGGPVLRQITYHHPDPGFAEILLTRLYETADTLIREDIQARTDNRIAYLTEALETVGHPDHRRALTRLMMEQEHLRMILAMNEPFAAEMAEPPAASPDPVRPDPVLVFPGLMMAGILLGFVAYTLRAQTRNGARPGS